MVNHPRRSQAAKASLEFARTLDKHIGGRIRLRLNGDCLFFDDAKKEIGVNHTKGATWLPAEQLLAHLTTSEVEELRSLPHWNGNNDYKLNLCIMLAVQKAAWRYNATPIKSSQNREDWAYFADGGHFIETIDQDQITRTRAE